MSVRVRYAPSPTGYQHIGGARTALFNYFFARSQGGRFILRIEDTDRERYSEEALQDIYETLHWLGITWDEGPQKGGEYGPYVQSQRFDLYREYARKLVENGAAYHCYCSPQRLQQVREQQSRDKQAVQGYDRHCRNLTEDQRRRYEQEGRPSVIRFKVPLEGTTQFEDQLLGTVKRKNQDINPDPVLLKSDQYPTYHLANVVDDHLMNISHIIRGQEWLSSGPLHVLLYEAFGWERPLYCHLPMVMGKDGQKLSKRHGSTSVREFREAGYLPEAVVNYVSLVGWSYDDKRQFFTHEELETLFSLEKLSKSPGVFDFKKLEWFNGQYIRAKTDEELKTLIKPYLQKSGIIHAPVTAEEDKVIDGSIPLIKERMHYLSEAPDLVGFLLRDIDRYDIEEVIPKKLDAEKTLQVLREVRALLEDFEAYTDEENEHRFREKAEELDVKLGAFLMPLRVAITGSRVSPPLFGSLRLLGLEKALERVDTVITLLEKGTENG
jgi:glutamyl-tRNA synthetase